MKVIIMERIKFTKDEDVKLIREGSDLIAILTKAGWVKDEPKAAKSK